MAATVVRMTAAVAIVVRMSTMIRGAVMTSATVCYRNAVISVAWAVIAVVSGNDTASVDGASA